MKKSIRNPVVLISLSICLLTYVGNLSAETVSLSGQWRFSLDREDKGIVERWYSKILSQKVRLPGSLPAQGIGDDITVETKWTGSIVDRSWFTAAEYEKYRKPGNIKVPFWLQPDKYYVGAAWYQRDIIIPENWRSKRLVLILERPHWETRVWYDDKFIGSNSALATPHIYELGSSHTPGKHTISIRVDNRMIVEVGVNSHSVSDHTQGNWNGIVGKIELISTEPVWLDDVQIFPDVKNKSIKVKGTIGNATGTKGMAPLQLQILQYSRGETRNIEPIAVRNLNSVWSSSGGSFETTIALGDKAKLWDEFNPNLYVLKAALSGYNSSKEVIFGLREISTTNTQFTINGRKTFIRGTLDCCIYPLTGHPPVDVESWKRVIQVAKNHGLNTIRFHSWCPPEAAFIAADELGFYFHVECSSWAPNLGDGRPIDNWIYEEADRILKFYGNHPSFVFLLYGNEPGGRNHRAYLSKWVAHYKEKDPRRLYSSGAGWPQLPENQFHVTPDPRIQAWGGGLKSRINAKPPETVTDYRDYINARTVPVISHEIGQWCVYPDFDEIKKYKGYLKAKNFEIFRDTLIANNMGDLARKFLMASGKLQALCYKEDIESALRTPGMGGFELLDLHDFPGQGTALVGVLNPFWESKGYITPEEYRRFCNSTVPLARLHSRVFYQNESLTADVEIAHFGSKPIENAEVYWKIVDEKGRTKLSSTFTSINIPVDNNIQIGKINAGLEKLSAPAKYKLVVGISKTAFENDWDFWVYPQKLPVVSTENILISSELNDKVKETLDKGGKVWLTIPPAQVKGDKYGKVALGFSSIFWNTAWTRRQPPHTLGILCDPDHPALKDFPTEYHSNWQWWYIVSRAGAMILNDLPPELRPTIQVIDDWFTNRRLGLAFEAKVGNGSIFVSSIDLENQLEDNPVARQLRYSILKYITGSAFKPSVKVTIDQLKKIIADKSIVQKLGVTIIKAAKSEPGYEPENILDGNTATIWHSAYTDSTPNFPHELVLGIKNPMPIQALVFTPRQDNNRNGWIKDFEIYISDTPDNWGKPVVSGRFSNNDQDKTVRFDKPIKAKYIRLVAKSGHSNGPWASLAELDFILE